MNSSRPNRGQRGSDAPRRTMYFAFVITENERTRKKFWNRVGAAWVNQDGSINVKLEALPVSGELQLRLPREDDEDGGGQ